MARIDTISFSSVVHKAGAERAYRMLKSYSIGVGGWTARSREDGFSSTNPARLVGVIPLQPPYYRTIPYYYTT